MKYLIDIEKHNFIPRNRCGGIDKKMGFDTTIETDKYSVKIVGPAVALSATVRSI